MKPRRLSVVDTTSVRQTGIMRYEMRLLENGWTAWDTQVNAPAVVEGCWQVSLSLDDADDLTELLNRLDREGKTLVPFPPPEEIWAVATSAPSRKSRPQRTTNP